MILNVDKNENYLLVALDGELNIKTLGTLRAQFDEILSSDQANIIFDFEKLEFIDSSGIGVLMNIYRNVHGKNGKVVFVAPNKEISEILEMTSLDVLVETYDSVQDAKAAFSK